MTDKSSPPPIPPTAAEKLETLFQDQALRNAQRRKNASTLSQFATSEANADAGRFAAINKANVVGATPKQPDYAAPNWSPDPVGVEPPLGFDINETPAVGEPWEVEASLERAEQEASSQSLDAQPPARGGEAVPLTSSATSSASPTQSQIQAETSQPAETSQQSLRSRRKPR